MCHLIEIYFSNYFFFKLIKFPLAIQKGSWLTSGISDILTIILKIFFKKSSSFGKSYSLVSFNRFLTLYFFQKILLFLKFVKLKSRGWLIFCFIRDFANLNSFSRELIVAIRPPPPPHPLPPWRAATAIPGGSLTLSKKIKVN